MGDGCRRRFFREGSTAKPVAARPELATWAGYLPLLGVVSLIAVVPIFSSDNGDRGGHIWPGSNRAPWAGRGPCELLRLQDARLRCMTRCGHAQPAWPGRQTLYPITRNDAPRLAGPHRQFGLRRIDSECPRSSGTRAEWSYVPAVRGDRRSLPLKGFPVVAISTPQEPKANAILRCDGPSVTCCHVSCSTLFELLPGLSRVAEFPGPVDDR